MNSPSSPDLEAQQRKNRIITIAGIVAAGAAAAYLLGGSGDHSNVENSGPGESKIIVPAPNPKPASNGVAQDPFFVPPIGGDDTLAESAGDIPNESLLPNSEDSSRKSDAPAADADSVSSAGTNKPVMPEVAKVSEKEKPSAAPEAEKDTTQNRQPGVASSESAPKTPPAEAKEPTAPTTKHLGLKLVRPAKPHAGVVSHTESVVNVREFEQALPTATPVSEAPNEKPKAVKVTKQQAQAYAKWATGTSRREGAITPSQHFRLPKAAETASAKTWREEDAPAHSLEKKPFGLILSDDSAPPAAKSTTPEGIPVKQIPEGSSALKKNGVDTPLWKRP